MARAAGQRRLALVDAERQLITMGRKVEEGSIADLLIEEVRWTAGHVRWLRGKIQEVEDEDLVWGVVEETEETSDGPGGLTETSRKKSAAVPVIWYELYERERKHLVSATTAALKAGVDERRLALAERQGEMVAAVIQRILDSLDLSPEQKLLAPQIASRELRALATA